jgi:hypothetical protein
MSHEEECESCGGDGFLETTEDTIERCDSCKKFANDELAGEAFVREAVLPLLEKAAVEKKLARHGSKEVRASHRERAHQLAVQAETNMDLVRNSKRKTLGLASHKTGRWR